MEGISNVYNKEETCGGMDKGENRLESQLWNHCRWAILTFPLIRIIDLASLSINPSRSFHSLEHFYIY
jgi:hypothetical protein